MTKPEPIYDSLNTLIRALGFEGESGTEAFYYLLRDVIEEIEDEDPIGKSHADGLCYDMCAEISVKLKERLNARN